jgi:hypothetical protein
MTTAHCRHREDCVNLDASYAYRWILRLYPSLERLLNYSSPLVGCLRLSLIVFPILDQEFRLNRS